AGIVAHDEIQHTRKEVRIGSGGAQGLRSDAAFGQKQAQTLRFAGDKRERLNRNDFSYFPRVVNRLFQRSICLSVNLWALIWNHHARVSAIGSSKRKPNRKLELGFNGLERI